MRTFFKTTSSVTAGVLLSGVIALTGAATSASAQVIEQTPPQGGPVGYVICLSDGVQIDAVKFAPNIASIGYAISYCWLSGADAVEVVFT